MHTQADSVVLHTNGLLISDFGSSTRGERHNSYYADPHQRAAHLVMFKISVGKRSEKPNYIFQQSKSNSQRPNTQFSPQWSNLNFSTDSFSKSSNSPDHLFRAWRHPHSSLISCLGFIMTMVIVISFAHERKTAPNDYAPELLTRIVQSATKLNDKI